MVSLKGSRGCGEYSCTYACANDVSGNDMCSGMWGSGFESLNSEAWPVWHFQSGRVCRLQVFLAQDRGSDLRSYKCLL